MTTETRLTEQDEKLLRGAAEISDADVARDIDDTLAEIAQWEREAEHLEQTPLSLPSSRLDHMRAGARRSHIAEATEFVRKLRRVLELRTGAVPDATGNRDSEHTK
jgi:hypothetical protein